MPNPMIGMPQGAEWLVILAIVVLVFGAAKLPDLARGTGQALRIFKAETKGLKDDDKNDDKAGDPPSGTAQNSTELPPAPAPAPARDETPVEDRQQRDTHNG